jgi:hypothetical protein
METTTIVLCVVYVITLILFGFLVRYYKDEIQNRVEMHNQLFKDFVDVILYNEILENQNLKYSKISRKLYNENKILKANLEYAISKNEKSEENN